MYCKCEFTECIKAESCKRINGDAAIMTFKSVCNEETNYKWYLKDKQKLPKNEENKAENEEKEVENGENS